LIIATTNEANLLPRKVGKYIIILWDYPKVLQFCK